MKRIRESKFAGRALPALLAMLVLATGTVLSAHEWFSQLLVPTASIIADENDSDVEYISALRELLALGESIPIGRAPALPRPIHTDRTLQRLSVPGIDLHGFRIVPHAWSSRAPPAA